MIAWYSYAWDGKDAKTFSELFLPDGVFEVVIPGESAPTVRLTSRAAIHAWASERHRDTAAAQSRHFQTGILFEAIEPQTARTRTMMLVTRQAPGPTAPDVRLTGVYHDEWRKTPAGWRLACRTARVDRDPGFAKHWA
jgi:hypothetical protein